MMMMMMKRSENINKHIASLKCPNTQKRWHWEWNVLSKIYTVRQKHLNVKNSRINNNRRQTISLSALQHLSYMYRVAQ